MRRSLRRFVSHGLAAAGALFAVAAYADYYTEEPIFIPYPKPGQTWVIENYGPVGIGLELIDPAFTMRIRNVEPGSPAEATGMLKKGQIIERINGATLRHIDPRVQLANILGQAEATDGRMRMQVRDVGEVVVQLPVLGAYSDTWPLDCPKSDRIVRNLADLIATQEQPRWGSVLFLLSTGEEKDLEVVRRWMAECEDIGAYPWQKAMRGPGLCEYYLRTGDRRILPVIKRMTDELSELMYCGSWSGRGKASFSYMAGGHMNAAGVHCLTFLLLARQCGVEVDEYMLQTVLRHFYRFAGHGNVAYGDQFPEGGFRDNGKTGALALAMQAAAQLTPGGEDSVYAQAREVSAMKSWYATSWFNRAHTGGGIGEIWHSAAAQLLEDDRPTQYRSFIDERRWFYELSRRHDGGIGVEDGGRYNRSASEFERSWGTYHALVYTAPRKTLRLFGAAPTEWCTTYTLPERPWGTPADDAFVSPVPAEYPPGQIQDLSEERIPTHASARFASDLDADASDEAILTVLHHPEYAYRSGMANRIVAHKRDHLVVPLLRSADPRVRHAGLLTMSGMFKGRALPDDRITDEMFQLAGAMIDDPDESWWVAQEAMKALSRARPALIAPHVERLVHFVEHDDWWLSTTALRALTKVSTDDRFFAEVLPAVGEAVATGRAFASTAPVDDIAKRLPAASAAAQALGLEVFTKAYFALPDPIVAPGGQVTPRQTEILRGRARSFVASVPGGDARLLHMPKLTARWQATRRDADRFVYDGTFTPNPDVLGTWKVVDSVPAVDAFTYDKTREPGTPPFARITFKPGGKTDQPDWLWSGDMLIPRSRPEVLRMVVRDVEVPPPPTPAPDAGAGGDALSGGLDDTFNAALEDMDLQDAPPVTTAPYLFIEVGGFSPTQPRDWTSPYYVLKRVAPDAR